MTLKVPEMDSTWKIRSRNDPLGYIRVHLVNFDMDFAHFSPKFTHFFTFLLKIGHIWVDFDTKSHFLQKKYGRFQ